MATSDPCRAEHLPGAGADLLKLPTFRKRALTRIAQLTSGEIRGRSAFVSGPPTGWL